jgi:hypothetical protein
MRLPDPPEKYSQDHQSDVQVRLEAEDAQNRKKGRDVEIGSARLILTSPDGARWSVTVDNAGVLSASVV